GSGPSGNGGMAVVGAPVWPSGATVAAEPVFMVTAEAASAAAPVNILRRSKPRFWESGKVSELVMFASHVFCWEENISPQSGIMRAVGRETTKGSHHCERSETIHLSVWG